VYQLTLTLTVTVTVSVTACCRVVRFTVSMTVNHHIADLLSIKSII